MIKVILTFEEQGPDDHRTNFKFVDCIARCTDSPMTERGEHQDYLGGLLFGQYEIQRRGHRFFISPGEILDAVDEAIDRHGQSYEGRQRE